MTEEYYINIIHKYLGKEASSQEEEELKRWLEESEANQERFGEERLLWKLSGEGKKLNLAIDVDQEFAALQDRIKADALASGESTEGRESGENKLDEEPKRRFNYLSIAASIVVLIALGLALQLGIGSSSDLIEISTLAEAQELVLADGSRVKLNAESILRYPETFEGDERRVYLEGEAFFEVSSDNEHPFLIETEQELVRVVGTAFNVKARANANESEVFVVEGIVEFGALEGESIRLTANNQGTLNRESGHLEKIEQANPNSIAWFSQELVFENSPLTEVIADLARLHQQEVRLVGDPEGCNFTGSFSAQSFKESIDEIGLIFNLEVIEVDDIYVLKGLKCN